MPWWGWMVIGMLLLGAELFIIEADFFLVFLGVAAMLTGLLGLALPARCRSGLQWLVFAGLALVSMVFFRKRVYRLLRRDVPIMADDMLSERLSAARRACRWTAPAAWSCAAPPGRRATSGRADSAGRDGAGRRCRRHHPAGRGR